MVERRLEEGNREKSGEERAQIIIEEDRPISQLTEIDPMSLAGAVKLSRKEREGPLRLHAKEKEREIRGEATASKDLI